MSGTLQPPANRRNAILGGVLVVIAVSGYFMGLRQTGSYVSLTHSSGGPAAAEGAAPHLAAPQIVSYSELDRETTGPNAGFASDLRTLVQPPATLAALTNVADAPRAQAVRARESHRAFDGAPPIVPHPIPQESSAACLACHGAGLAVKDRVASRISHAQYASCTQCHVPATTGTGITRDPALLAALADNVFIAPSSPTRGSRAWDGAPPTIPHSTLMRSDCNSCHGPTGLFGLRTPHPDRQSCTQCHAPDATLDQSPMLGSVAP